MSLALCGIQTLVRRIGDGRIERHIQDVKEKALKACTELPDDVCIEEVFDHITTAHSDTIRPSGQSPWQMLLGRAPPGLGLSTANNAEFHDLANRSAMEDRTAVRKAAWKAHVEHELATQTARAQLARTRSHRTWEAGER